MKDTTQKNQEYLNILLIKKVEVEKLCMYVCMHAIQNYNNICSYSLKYLIIL
jgi:hypothetical protein